MENQKSNTNSKATILKVLSQAVKNFKTHFKKDPVALTINPYTKNLFDKEIVIFNKAEDNLKNTHFVVGGVKLEVIVNDDTKQTQLLELK